jgi:hypothetical protein
MNSVTNIKHFDGSGMNSVTNIKHFDGSGMNSVTNIKHFDDSGMNASVFKFLLALQLLLARPASIKWILLATRNFHSPLASWQAVISHTEYMRDIR